MPRPRKCCRIFQEPDVSSFKPHGAPLCAASPCRQAEVQLHVESLEAMRLADLEDMTMGEAAERMHVSRHTFGRILARGRKAVTRALVQGRTLRIEGGHYELHEPPEFSEQTRKAPKEFDMTKVAVTSEGPTLQDKVDPRFGRAGGFVVVDVETMETEYIDNGGSQAMAHGAGIQAAQRVADAGAKVVLTGFVGPKAFQALKAAGLQVGQDLDGVTVAEAVERYKNGQVAMAASPNK